MIGEVDRALAGLLERELGKGVAVSFAPPAAMRPDQQKAGAVLDLHLLDVREETEMKAAGTMRATADDGTVVRIGPPRWYRLSYWLTAWAKDASIEHDALGDALTVLASHDTVPADLLEGGFAGGDRPVRLEVAAPPAGDAFALSVWASLQLPMKGAIHVAVVAPVAPGAGAATAKGVIDRRLRMTGPPPKPAPAIMPPPGIPGALMPAAATGPAAPAAAPEPAPPPRPDAIEDLTFGPDPTAPPRPPG